MSFPGGEIFQVKIGMEGDNGHPPSYIGTETRTFMVVSTAMHFALWILETKESRNAVDEISESLIKRDMARFIRWHHDRESRRAQVANEINRFLGQIKNDFPYVLLKKSMEAEAALVSTNAWHDDPSIWNPKISGKVLVNGMGVENTVMAGMRSLDLSLNQRDRDTMLENFEIGMFNLGVSIAHELVHQYVRYLCGHVGTYTPEEISTPWAVPSYPWAGESGWLWEAKVLGDGQLQPRENCRSPLGLQQSNTLYSMPRGSNTATRVSRRYIQDMLHFRFSQVRLSQDKPIRLENLPPWLGLLGRSIMPRPGPQTTTSQRSRMPSHRILLRGYIVPSILCA